MKRLIALVVFAGLPCMAFGTACNLATSNGIACVQSEQNTAASTSANVVMTTSNTSGNLILVQVTCTADQPSAPTDTRNTYSQVGTNVDIGASSSWTGMYYTANIGAGANTVVLHCGASASTTKGAVFEISGLATSTPLDKTAQASGTTTTPASGATATTSQAIELAFGGLATNDSTTTAVAGSGWTLEQIINNSQFETELQILTSTGTPSATWNAIASSKNWASIIGTFKAATVGSAAPTQASPFVVQ